MPDNLSWKALCAQAKRELAAGQNGAARRLARQAAKLAPHREEPWLLLASIASPQAGKAYANKALAINPRSRKARAALSRAERGASGAEAVLPRSANLALLSLLGLT